MVDLHHLDGLDGCLSLTGLPRWTTFITWMEDFHYLEHPGLDLDLDLDGWTDGWMVDGWVDGRMDGWLINGWKDGWMAGRMD
eukprot:11451137-Karenia_brevis.AAC.1